MKRFGLLVALFAALLMAGCAATGPKYAEVEGSLPTLRPGEARIFFYRDNATVGAAVQPEVRLDGQVVGTSKPGSFFFVDRPAGRYTASVRTESESTVEVDLAPGDVGYVSLQISLGVFVGRPQLTLQPPATGAAALGGLAYVGGVPLVPGRPAVAGATRPPGTPGQPAPGQAGPRPAGPVTLDDLRGLMPASSRP